MMRRASIIFALGLAACGGAKEGEERECNDGGSTNTLNGSYCEDVSMLYKEVKCLTVGQALRIEYVRPIGTGSEKTLQIIVSGENVVLEAGTEIKLLDVGAEVRRIIADAQAPITLTGELEASSSLIFSEYTGMIGTPAKGSFAMLFKSGRNLRGEFECTVEDARPAGT
jgi:hypothetical protein